MFLLTQCVIGYLIWDLHFVTKWVKEALHLRYIPLMPSPEPALIQQKMSASKIHDKIYYVNLFLSTHHSMNSFQANEGRVIEVHIKSSFCCTGVFTGLQPHEEFLFLLCFSQAASIYIQMFTHFHTAFNLFDNSEASCSDILTLCFPFASTVSSLTVGCNLSPTCFNVTENMDADVTSQCTEMHRAYFVLRKKKQNKTASCLNFLLTKSIKCSW